MNESEYFSHHALVARSVSTGMLLLTGLLLTQVAIINTGDEL